MNEGFNRFAFNPQLLAALLTGILVFVSKRRFLLRYKLLLVLTIIPLLTLSAYLYLAIQIFKDDKIAYVFDSSSNFVNSLASQLQTQLQSVLYESRPFLQEFISKKYFDEQAKSFFNENASLDHFLIYRIDDQSVQYFQLGAWLSQTPGKLAALQQEIEIQLRKDNFELVKKLLTEKRNILALKDGSFALVEAFENPEDKTNYVFIGIAGLEEVLSVFRSSLNQRIFLVRSSGEILFKPQEFEGTHLSNVFDFASLEDKLKNFPQGVDDTKTLGGEEVLLSFAKTGYSDVSVLGMVSKKSAFSAVDILVRRSVIFFGFLLCLTVIVSLLAASKLTAALTQLFEATKKVATGEFDVKIAVTSNDEIAELSTNFNIMAQEISKLLMETAQKARMEGELQTARTVQETLFPETEKHLEPLGIAGFYEPASECGGDWWHYCHVGGKIYLWIGDATGHGAPAALITSAAKSAATLIEALLIPPGKAIELMNQAIYDVSKGRIMMTFALASFDPKTGELVYVNASHEAPFLVRNKSDALKKKDLEFLNETNNPRLGQSRDSVYQESRIILEQNDFVFFYTDGIADIQNPELKTWGEREFLKNFILAYNGAREQNADISKDFKDILVNAIQTYRQGTQLLDDITFFAVTYEGAKTDVEISV